MVSVVTESKLMINSCLREGSDLIVRSLDGGGCVVIGGLQYESFFRGPDSG